MEPTLVVIGISYRTAPLSVRERFHMSESDRLEAIKALVRSEDVDEVVVFSSCNRTEFYVWTQRAAEAANSVLRFLTRAYNLTLAEWTNFYRLVGDAAMTHVCRVAAGLDSRILGDGEVGPLLDSAWHLAQRAGTTGCFLDSVLGRAIETAERIGSDIPGANSITPISRAALERCREIFPDVHKRSVLVIGAGRLAESVVCELQKAGVTRISVTNRTSARVQALHSVLKFTVIPYDKRWQALESSDIVVTATTSSKPIVGRDEIELVMRNRADRPLVAIDCGLPRNIHPTVRSVSAVFLSDLDDFCENAGRTRTADVARERAERAVREIAAGFHRGLLQERVVPTITALRQIIQDICDQELNNVNDQFGPLTEDQQEVMQAYGAHISQRISALIARHMRPGVAQHEVEVAELVASIFGVNQAAEKLKVAGH